MDNCLMSTPRELPPHLLAGLKARDSWKNRKYSVALDQAGEAAALACDAQDQVSWWNMRFLQGECLRDQGSVLECMELARTLAEHPLSGARPPLAARASTLLAVSLQGLGRLPEAAEAASAGASLVAGDSEHVYVHIQARLALIAALAESRRLDEAWRECLILKSLLTEDVDEDTVGKAYWVIGNVAFLGNRVLEGSGYHDLAAEHLSPSKNVDIWARFNRASAEMRLEAELGDAATLRCIERAELATTVVGGSDRDLLEMSLVRAHWHFLTGDMSTAIRLLEPLCIQSAILAAQTAAEAYFLLGKALLSTGVTSESVHFFEEAATLFDTAEASERSAAVRAFMASAQGHSRHLQGGQVSEAIMVPERAPAFPLPGTYDVEFHLVRDGIVKASLPKEAHLDEEAADRFGAQLNAYTGSRPVAVVLDVTGVASVSRAARSVYCRIPSVSAWALLGETPVDRLIGHFLLEAEFSSGPARYFSSEDEALGWLTETTDVR